MVPVLVLVVVFICWVIYWNDIAWQKVRDDKKKAERGLYRIPEEELLNDAWLGGIGGLLALFFCKHKTRTTKQKFMKEYRRRATLCFIGHIIAAIVIFLLTYYAAYY